MSNNFARGPNLGRAHPLRDYCGNSGLVQLSGSGHRRGPTSAWRGLRVDAVDAIDATQADYNRPFRGAFKIESETVTASLRQLRETLSPYCDVNGCVVPESADDAGGFGGIIAPPWWDDFQEP